MRVDCDEARCDGRCMISVFRVFCAIHVRVGAHAGYRPRAPHVPGGPYLLLVLEACVISIYHDGERAGPRVDAPHRNNCHGD